MLVREDKPCDRDHWDGQCGRGYPLPVLVFSAAILLLLGGNPMCVSIEVQTDAFWSELADWALFRDCLTDEEFLEWLMMDG